MGRNKIDVDSKKKTVSVSLDVQVFDDLDRLDAKSKSQLINKLLTEHFGMKDEKEGDATKRN